MIFSFISLFITSLTKSNEKVQASQHKLIGSGSLKSSVVNLSEEACVLLPGYKGSILNTFHLKFKVKTLHANQPLQIYLEFLYSKG